MLGCKPFVCLYSNVCEKKTKSDFFQIFNPIFVVKTPINMELICQIKWFTIIFSFTVTPQVWMVHIIPKWSVYGIGFHSNYVIGFT